MHRTARPSAPPVASLDQGLQSELQQKTCSLVAVQRNYDVLSRVMQQKQQELDELKRQHDEESRRALSLGIKLDDALARVQRAEAGTARLHMVEAQLAALEKQKVKLTIDVETLTAQVTSNATRMKSLQKAAEESEFKVASVRREANTWQNSVAAAQEESRKAVEKCDLAKGEILALKKELGIAREASMHAAKQRQAAEAHAARLELVLQNRDEQSTALKDTIRSLQDELGDLDSTSKALQVTLTALRQQCWVAEEQAQSMCRSLVLAGDNQRAAEKTSQSLQESLTQAQVEIKERDAKVAQMKYLLEDAEDRYQALLTRGMEETEGLARLNMQLVQSKAMARAAQENLATAQTEHALSLQDARLATQAAEQHAAELATHNMAVRRSHACFLENIISRVDKSLHGVSTLQAESGWILGELSDSQERSLHVLTCRLQKMETQWSGVEDLVAGIDTTISSLSALLGDQAFKHVSAADAAQVQITNLQGLLAAERAAKATVVEEKRQMEASHRGALETLHATAGERLEAERQRLNLRLANVEGGVMKLKAACEADHAEALRMLDLERRQMDKKLQAIIEQAALKDKKIAELIKELASAGEQEIGALSTRHMEEVERMSKEHAAEIAEHKALLQTTQANVCAAWETGHLLFQDMALLNQHLKKLGWEVKELDKGAMPAKGAENGTGIELAKACALLRLHFGHVTEAVQDFARKAAKALAPPPPPPPKPEQTSDWKALAKELRTTVHKLVHVEDALASNCTCMLCLEVLKHPVTCVPGGHTYCKACFEANNYECDECGCRVEQTVANTALEAICSKFEYKHQALQAIQQAISKASALQ